VGRDLCFEFSLERAEVFLPPEVAHDEGRVPIRCGEGAPWVPFHANGGFDFAAIE